MDLPLCVRKHLEPGIILSETCQAWGVGTRDRTSFSSEVQPLQAQHFHFHQIFHGLQDVTPEEAKKATPPKAKKAGPG